VLAVGSPAEVKKPLEGTAAAAWVALNPSYYQELARRHRDGVKPLD
jgi:carbonic anhydrase/acetyltransferase-like protein (isoleucine patch superfamily)